MLLLLRFHKASWTLPSHLLLHPLFKQLQTRHILICQRLCHLKWPDLYSTVTSRRWFWGKGGAAILPLPSRSEKKPPWITFFLGAICPKQQDLYNPWVPPGQSTAQDTGKEEPVWLQHSPIHGKERVACLEWVTEGICLAFGGKKSIPVTFQCSLGQLINGVAVTASPEGKEHIFTSLASKDISTRQERLRRDWWK